MLVIIAIGGPIAIGDFNFPFRGFLKATDAVLAVAPVVIFVVIIHNSSTYYCNYGITTSNRRQCLEDSYFSHTVTKCA